MHQKQMEKKENYGDYDIARIYSRVDAFTGDNMMRYATHVTMLKVVWSQEDTQN